VPISHTADSLGSTRRWPWHFMGTTAAVSLLLMWLPIFFRPRSLPRISLWWLVGWFFCSALLSIAAGYKASRWWFLVTVCFGLTLILLWIGEVLWESRATGHW
jgi:hypothetical protein